MALVTSPSPVKRRTARKFLEHCVKHLELQRRVLTSIGHGGRARIASQLDQHLSERMENQDDDMETVAWIAERMTGSGGGEDLSRLRLCGMLLEAVALQYPMLWTDQQIEDFMERVSQ